MKELTTGQKEVIVPDEIYGPGEAPRINSGRFSARNPNEQRMPRYDTFFDEAKKKKYSDMIDDYIAEVLYGKPYTTKYRSFKYDPGMSMEDVLRGMGINPDGKR